MTDTDSSAPFKQAPVPVKEVISGSWREMMVKWLFNQSVPTVLLFAILAAIVWGIPRYIIPAIHLGYEQNAKSLERTEAIRAETTYRQFELLIQIHERDRATFERAVQAMERRM